MLIISYAIGLNSYTGKLRSLDDKDGGGGQKIFQSGQEIFINTEFNEHLSR